MDNNTRLLNAGRNLILLNKARGLISRFKRKNIDSLVLKGLYLAFNIYPDACFRPMADIDLLVKREDLDRIDEILTGLGYVDISPEGQRTYGCDATFYNKDKVYIDISWDLSQYERFKGTIDITDDSWKKACEFDLGGIPAWTLSVEDHILHVSLDYGLINLLEGIKGAYDLFYLIDGRPVKWKGIIDNARKHGIKIPLYYSLRKASLITGLRLPDFALSSLRPSFLKGALLDRMIPKYNMTVLRYLCQALMMGSFASSLKVLWRCLKGIPRAYRRNYGTSKD